MKSGLQKEGVKLGTLWLRSGQDEQTGRVHGRRGVEAALVAHALAAVYERSSYRTLKPVAVKAVQAVRDEIASLPPDAPLDPRTGALVLLAMADAGLGIDASVAERWQRSSRAPRDLAARAAELAARVVTKPAERDPLEIERCTQLVLAAGFPRDGDEQDEVALFVAAAALHRAGGIVQETWSRRLHEFDRTSPPDASSTMALALRSASLALAATRRGPPFRSVADQTEPAAAAGDGAKNPR